MTAPPCWWRRRCCGAGRRPSSPTRRTGCSPTRRCSRPPPNRWPRTGPGGWRAPPCTTSTCSIGTELAALRNSAALRGRQRHRSGPAGDGAATTSRGVDAAAAPTRCGPSPATPSSSPIPPGAAAGGAGSIRATTRRRWTHCSTSTRGRDLVVKCAPGIDFDEVRAARIRRRDRGDVAGGQRARGVPVVGGAGRAGGDPPGHDAGHAASRSPTPSPTTAPVAPAGRWIVDPDGAVVRAGSGAALRAPGTDCGSSTPTSPTCPATDCPTACAGSRCSSELDLQRTATAPGAFGAVTSGARRDPGPRRRRRPRRVAGPAAAARIATGLGGHHPHRLRSGKPGNGIHLPTVALIWPRVAYCVRGGAGAAHAPEGSRATSDDAHSRGGRGSSRPVYWPARPALPALGGAAEVRRPRRAVDAGPDLHDPGRRSRPTP